MNGGGNDMMRATKDLIMYTTDDTFYAILEKALTVTRWTKKSGKGAAAWLTACISTGCTRIMLLNSVKTRFCSTFKAMVVFISHRAAVDNLCTNGIHRKLEARKLSSDEWDLMAEARDLLSFPCKVCLKSQDAGGLWSLAEGTERLLQVYGDAVKGLEVCVILNPKP
jgi:hypothetical protein